MTIARRKGWKPCLLFGVAILCLLLGARMFAWYSAVRFGHANVAVLSSLGTSAFEDTEGLIGFYAEPDLVAHEKWVNTLSFAAPGYQRSFTEFKTGMIYLSRQFSLPQAERFQNPPKFRNLVLERSDSSEEGLRRSVEKLVISYQEAL